MYFININIYYLNKRTIVNVLLDNMLKYINNPSFQVQVMSAAAKRAILCSVLLWIFGVSCFLVSVVFDWKNFTELQENEKQFNTTKNQFCDNVNNGYPWIFMVFIFCKMICGILEYISGALSLCKQNNNDNIWDTISLVFCMITTIFQTLDLLLLVLYSYRCLDDDRSHQIQAFISYEKDDFVASVFGTFGIAFNLALKKNILTVFKAVCCSDDASKKHKILSCTCLFFIIVCFVLALMLSAKM